MEISDIKFDGGKPFDWGKTSSDYAKFRDIYPQEFYQRIIDLGLCIEGQSALDIGTGTGVLPRNLYRYGAKWAAADISQNQIAKAKLLSKDMAIDYLAVPAEDIDFPDNTFDVVTACQCFGYFNHKIIMPKLWHMLKPSGSLLVLWMAWLPFDDKIAAASEGLVLKYNPGWTGAGERMHPIAVPACYNGKFELSYHDEFLLQVPFTRESWNGRMKACRGVGASLNEDEIGRWEEEHIELLQRIAPSEFNILHYGAIARFIKKEV